MKPIYCLLTALVVAHTSISQDFIRLGVGASLIKSNFIQTFSLDLNRSEKVDEKTGRYALFNNKGFYILPSIDVNLGAGTTASENNVLSQAVIGRLWFGEKAQSKDRLKTGVWNKAIELNPSYNTDKNFVEELAFAQVKGLLHYIQSKHTSTDPNTSFLKRELTFSGGLFSNVGHRYSGLYDTGDFYWTAGALVNLKSRFRVKREKPQDDWILGLSGNYYGILSEVGALTDDDWAGSVKISIDKNITSNLYLGLAYKLTNDNPTYADVNTIEFSFKVKY